MYQSEPRWGRPSRLVASLLIAVCASAVAGCGAGDSSESANGDVTLRFSWWGSDVRAELTTKAIKQFEARNANIKVQTDYAAYPAYWQKIATETAGGNAPDVIQTDYRYLAEYGERNALLDLGNHADVLPLTDIEAALAESGKIDDKMVAVPFGQNTTGIAIDTTALKALGLAAPKAGGWSAFAAWAADVHKKSDGKVHGVSDMGYSEDVFEVWLRQNGKTLFTDDGKLGFTKEDVTAFWTLWQDMVKSGAATPAEISNQYDGTAAKSALVQGKAAAEFIFDNTLGATQEATKNQLALVAFPSVGANSGQYYKPTMLLSASTKSAHPKEAAQLINFLINDAEAGKILGVDRGLPANTKVRSAVVGSLTGPAKLVVDYEDSVKSALAATPAAPPKGDGEIKNLMQSTYQGVTSGTTPIAAAVDTFYTQAQQAIGA